MGSDDVVNAAPPGHKDFLEGAGGPATSSQVPELHQAQGMKGSLDGTLDEPCRHTLGFSQTPHASHSGASTATSSRRATLERGETGQDGMDASKDEICFDFTKGLCTRGDKCKYTHDLATIVSVNSREKGICFDFLRPSGCHRGLLCRFSHDLSSIAQQCAQQNAQSSCSEGGQAGGKTNKAICFDFVKGVCERGPDCRYSHDLSLIARTGRGGPQSQKTQEVCYDFLRGRCDRGSACKYSHNTSLLAQPPSSNPPAAGAHHPAHSFDFGPDGLLDPAVLGPPGGSSAAASHPKHPPPVAALPPPHPHPLGPGPPAAHHHVPFLPMHGASCYEPTIPLHLQHPGSYMRHPPHHPLHHYHHHPHHGHYSTAQLADSHAAVLRHLAVLQQHNQLAAAAATSAPLHHALYPPLPPPLVPLPPPSSNPWLADAATTKAGAAAAVSQPPPLPTPSPPLRENINAGAAAAAAAAAQHPQPERAPLCALRDVSNTLHQHPSSSNAGPPAASQKLAPIGASAAAKATAAATKSSSGGAGAMGPAAAPGSAPISMGRLGSYSSSSSGCSSVVGSLRTPSPFPDAVVAPVECSGDGRVKTHREDARLPPPAAVAAAFSAPLAFGGCPPGNGGQGPAVWPALPHGPAAPRLLGNSRSISGGGGSPLSVEAISAALAGLGNDPHALAHALSSLAAAVQAQADSASSPSFGQCQGPGLQQQLAHFLGGAARAADDDLLGAKDQQLCEPLPHPPLHAFATGFGHGNFRSSPMAGFGGGPSSFSSSPNQLPPANSPQKAEADAGDDGFASLAPDLLPLLQEIWNK